MPYKKDPIRLVRCKRMTVPGFIGRASYTPKMLRPTQNAVPGVPKSSKSIPQRRSERLNIRGPIRRSLEREPAISGRAAWKALEQSCSLLQCQKCRNDCIRMVDGLHAAVNMKLGKPPERLNDLRFLHEYLQTSYNYYFGPSIVKQSTGSKAFSFD